MKNRGALIVAALAVAACAFLWERNVRMRTEVAALQRENAELQVALKQREQATPHADEAGRERLEDLKRDKAELLRLRGEVARLRKRHAAAPNSPASSQPQAQSQVTAAPAEADSETANPELANLTDEQRNLLDSLSEKVVTNTGLDDVDRLKDSLNRWDELFVNPAPAEMKPVFEILRARVEQRIADLEAQK